MRAPPLSTVGTPEAERASIRPRQAPEISAHLREPDMKYHTQMFGSGRASRRIIGSYHLERQDVPLKSEEEREKNIPEGAVPSSALVATLIRISWRTSNGEPGDPAGPGSQRWLSCWSPNISAGVGEPPQRWNEGGGTARPESRDFMVLQI